MRIPTRPRERGLQFNITPLIDVIFLLIIFFLAATYFIQNETLEAVELPEAVAAEDDHNQQPRRLVVTITADHKLHVGGKVAELPAVEQMILGGSEEHGGGFEVRIRGDRTVPYRVVEPLMLACARAGVSHVKFAVMPR